MVIKYKDEYDKLLTQLDPKIKNNGAFAFNFGNVVEDFLHSGEELEIEIYNDGKSIRATERNTNNSLKGLKNSSVNVIDVTLTSDAGIEVLRSTGNLRPATDYYISPTAGSSPSINIQSVLSVSYDKHIADSDGIEMYSASYFKGGIPCGNVPYDNTDCLIQLLLSAGNIMPIFYGKTVELPTNSSLSIFESLEREEDNPAIVIRKRIERGKSAELEDYAISCYSMGLVNSYWPELLKYSTDESFADNMDGEWMIRKEGFRTADAKSVDEIIDRCTYIFGENLETSNTKKMCPTEYEALRKRTDAAIENIEAKKYKK